MRVYSHASVLTEYPVISFEIGKVRAGIRPAVTGDAALRLLYTGIQKPAPGALQQSWCGQNGILAL